jgi:DNA-binding XRE family transcriptional regulator
MDDLARLLNVTRQTIYNIEHIPGRMSTVCYLAIRMLIVQECQMYNEDLLPYAVSVLVDRHGITEPERQKIRDIVVENCQRLGTKRGTEEVAKSISQELEGIFDSTKSF